MHLVSDMMSGAPDIEDADESKLAVGLDGLYEQLVSRAKADGLQLTGEGGLLQHSRSGCWSPPWMGSTDHLRYDKHDPASRSTGNSRNGTRSKRC
jgi:putative transposase